MKAGAYLPSYMDMPLWSFSENEGHAPISLANQPNTETPLPLFEHYAQPGQERVQATFNAAMEAYSITLPPRTLLNGLLLITCALIRPKLIRRYAGFDWGRLPLESLVVDVGGGIGSMTRTVLREHPNLSYIVQDLPGTLEDARKARIPVNQCVYST
jgi:hypothetical protein